MTGVQTCALPISFIALILAISSLLSWTTEAGAGFSPLAEALHRVLQGGEGSHGVGGGRRWPGPRGRQQGGEKGLQKLLHV